MLHGAKRFAVPPIFARKNPRLILPCHARNAPDSRREAPDCPANGFRRELSADDSLSDSRCPVRPVLHRSMTTQLYQSAAKMSIAFGRILPLSRRILSSVRTYTRTGAVYGNFPFRQRRADAKTASPPPPTEALGIPRSDCAACLLADLRCQCAVVVSAAEGDAGGALRRANAGLDSSGADAADDFPARADFPAPQASGARREVRGDARFLRHPRRRGRPRAAQPTAWARAPVSEPHRPRGESQRMRFGGAVPPRGNGHRGEKSRRDGHGRFIRP